MCVGALLESDVEALVFARPERRATARPGSVIQLAQHPSLPRRIKVVSGIRRDEAEALFAPLAALADGEVARRRPDRARTPGGEVAE